ncbi:TerD family protein [Chromatium okenii]|jgi:stress response protein SCP2|uniref:TerD domain-containing protein n=1 Tax=Chromatium okenii TaxID=61644 RepID=A0A2S7XM58_9GAMM|nr:TerD family protein [Chromatium okenii]MBV5308900.1 TerD family protein [Chromatium okenii]PQJ94814.1 hypothetical protein CXB77_18360 [Chromatium okenii]
MNQLLQPGANIKLNAFSGTVVISHSIDQRFDINLVCFLINESGKTQDLLGAVYPNQPHHPSGAVIFIPPEDLSGTKNHSIEFDLRKVPAGIKKLIVTLADNNHIGLSELKNLKAEVRIGSEIISLNQDTLTIENGIIVLELYILNEQAKVRSVWQGFSSGLEGLCQHYGSKLIEISSVHSILIKKIDESLLNPHYVMRYTDYDREIYGKNLTAIFVNSCRAFSENQSRLLRSLLKSMNLDERMVEFIDNSRYINEDSFSEFLDFIKKECLVGSFMVDILVLCQVETDLTDEQYQIFTALTEKTQISSIKLKQALELANLILNKNNHDKINFDLSFFKLHAWSNFINDEKTKKSQLGRLYLTLHAYFSEKQKNEHRLKNEEVEEKNDLKNVRLFQAIRAIQEMQAIAQVRDILEENIRYLTQMQKYMD